MDNRGKPDNLSNVWCLLLGTTCTVGFVNGYGLILVRAEEATTKRDFNVYTRIGMFFYVPSGPINVWESAAVTCGKSTVYII
jgi:hypothetical protein